MKTYSKASAILALIFAAVGFIPFLGWLNWLALIFSVSGTVTGIKIKETAWVRVNVGVIVLALIRLSMGYGIF